VDGHEELVAEMAAASSELKHAAGAAFADLLANPDFANVLPGLIAEPEPSRLMLDRFRRLSA